MEVGFRAGTTAPQAKDVMKRCSHYRGVIRSGVQVTPGGHLSGQMWTTKLGGPASMLHCLRSALAVTSEAFLG